MKSGLISSPFFTVEGHCSSYQGLLYSHINWSLVQAQQQFSLGMPQPSTSMRFGKARPKIGFGLMCKNGFYRLLMVGLWPKSLTGRPGLRVIMVARHPLEVYLLVPWSQGRGGVMRMMFLMCCSFQLL